MANIMRRERDSGAQTGLGPATLDPFRVMREMLRWDPFREIESVVPTVAREFIPNFDVRETKDAFVITADLPGVQDEDLEISIAGNRLTVSGRREEEKTEKGDQYYACERAYGTFTRSFTLPEGADPEHVNAELRDGILTITIPKRPEVQPKRVALGSSAKGALGAAKEKVSNVAEAVKEKLTGARSESARSETSSGEAAAVTPPSSEPRKDAAGERRQKP